MNERGSGHVEVPFDAPAWTLALQDSPLGLAMRQSLYLYPLVEILHILGFVILVGSIVGLDLRLIGARRFIAADDLARHLLPLAIGGFLLAVSMGAFLFTAEAAAVYSNPAFRVKIILIVLAGLNAALFHLGPWRRIADWRFGQPSPLAARIGGSLSILFWLGVVVCGRLIAYL